MNLTRLAGAYAVATAILAAALATAILAGPYRAIQRSDYMTYHVAARMVLAGDGDDLYDAQAQADAQRALIGEEPTFERGALPFNSPPWLAALVAPLGWLPLGAGFAVFVILGLALLTVSAWMLAPGAGVARTLGPLLVLTAWPTVMAGIRGQLTIPVVGLLGLSVALARYRSGAALGLAALKPTLVPLWGLWQLLGGHWRAVAAALAGLLALLGLSLVVVGPQAVLAYPGHLLDVGGPDAIGVHVDEMLNWRGAADRLGLDAWFVVAGSVLTLGAVAYAWARTDDRRLGAATAFLATPLVIPHANQHEAVLGALGILVLVAATGGSLRSRLAAGAITTHAALWAGPALPGQASGWLLFAALLAWLAAAAWLAGHHARSTSVR